MSFISYYFHWDHDSVMALSHEQRRKWCREISGINAKLMPSDKKEKSLFDLKPTNKW